MKFYKNKEELGFDDVSIVPQLSSIESRNDVNIYTNYGNMKNCTPYFITGMSSVGNVKAAQFLSKYNIPVAIHKYIDTYDLERHIDSEFSKNTIISIGLDDYSKRHLRLIKKHPYLLIDAPNAYINKFYELCDRCRQAFPDAWIMAGNVINSTAVNKLARYGINVARLGIGGGSVCRTSDKTGVGRKPISAILECTDYSIDICWDGGIRSSSDICKALHAGAKYVSLGRLFAPFVEINQNQPIPAIDPFYSFPLEKIPEQIPYYGMSSEHANNKYAGGLKEYRAAEGVKEYLKVEKDPHKLIMDINGSIRSYMTYAGISKLTS